MYINAIPCQSLTPAQAQELAKLPQTSNTEAEINKALDKIEETLLWTYSQRTLSSIKNIYHGRISSNAQIIEDNLENSTLTKLAERIKTQAERIQSQDDPNFTKISTKIEQLERSFKKKQLSESQVLNDSKASLKKLPPIPYGTLIQELKWNPSRKYISALFNWGKSHPHRILHTLDSEQIDALSNQASATDSIVQKILTEHKEKKMLPNTPQKAKDLARRAEQIAKSGSTTDDPVFKIIKKTLLESYITRTCSAIRNLYYQTFSSNAHILEENLGKKTLEALKEKTSGSDTESKQLKQKIDHLLKKFLPQKSPPTPPSPPPTAQEEPTPSLENLVNAETKDLFIDGLGKLTCFSRGYKKTKPTNVRKTISRLNPDNQLQLIQNLLNKLTEKIKDLTPDSEEMTRFSTMRAQLEKIKKILSSTTPNIDSLSFDIKTTQTSCKKPVGINNPCNNCWAIALMQLIINTPTLKNLFSIYTKDPKRYQFIYNFIQEYNTQQSSNTPQSLESNSLRKGFHELNPQNISDSSSRQEDASEPLLDIFNAIPNDAGFALPIQQQKVDPNAVEYTELLALNLNENQTDALKKNKSYFENPNIAIELINEYLTVRHGDDQHIICMKKLLKTPNQLLLYFPRFSQNPDGLRSKITQSVAFPTTLTLDETQIKDCENPVSYECTGFVRHDGESLERGHYVAYLKVGDKYFYCSDDTISEISFDTFKDYMKQGYIYYYEKTS